MENVHAPEAVDLTQESDATPKALYGLNETRITRNDYGTALLRARRLVERGRAICSRRQRIYRRRGKRRQPNWDAHEDLEKNHRAFMPRPSINRSTRCSPI